MKTLSIGLIALMLVAAFAVPLAAAQEDSDSSDAIALYDDTSDLPEGIVISPAPAADDDIAQEAEDDMDEDTSSLSVGWNQVRTWFTFNQEKKAQLELQLAKMRLIQAKVAARNNNTNAMENALEAHERTMERVRERINNIEFDSGSANESALRFKGLERAIQVHERRIGLLIEALENADLSEEARAGIEAKIGQMENVTGQLVQLREAKSDRVRTRIMAIANLTEHEAEQLMEQVQERARNREEVKEQAKLSFDDSDNESEDELETESGSDNKQLGKEGSEDESEED